MVPQKDRLLYTNAYQEVTGKPISLITPEELAMKAGDVDKIVAPMLIERAAKHAEATRKPDVLSPPAEAQRIKIAKESKDVKPTAISSLSKLYNERDLAPEGSERRKGLDKKIELTINKDDSKVPPGITAQYNYIYGSPPPKGDAGVAALSKLKKDLSPLTEKETGLELRKKALPVISKIDPNEAYGRGWKMNDDGSVFTEIDTGAPVKLPTFEKVMGKRGMTMAVIGVGDFYQDAKDIQTSLKDPEVAKVLGAANKAGYWDVAKGTWKNSINGWLLKNGYGFNTKTTQTVIKMGKLASQQRKEFLGTATSVAELGTVRSWMPEIGDNYELMTAKINFAASEGKEDLMNFLESYKDIANMSPFYDRFGIDRFNAKASPGSDAAALIKKYGKK